jgi:hypothetical protein
MGVTTHMFNLQVCTQVQYAAVFLFVFYSLYTCTRVCKVVLFSYCLCVCLSVCPSGHVFVCAHGCIQSLSREWPTDRHHFDVRCVGQVGQICMHCNFQDGWYGSHLGFHDKIISTHYLKAKNAWTDSHTFFHVIQHVCLYGRSALQTNAPIDLGSIEVQLCATISRHSQVKSRSPIHMMVPDIIKNIFFFRFFSDLQTITFPTDLWNSKVQKVNTKQN